VVEREEVLLGGGGERGHSVWDVVREAKEGWRVVWWVALITHHGFDLFWPIKRIVLCREQKGYYGDRKPYRGD
jgi:hypothetical protein